MLRRSDGKAGVLVVEDEILIALELSGMIEDAGCRVLGPAVNVAAALSLLAQADPAAAFLDENLNGASVAPVVHALAARRIPFVILSGYARSTSDDPSLQAAPRLEKPASTRQIRGVLAQLLSEAGPWPPRGSA